MPTTVKLLPLMRDGGAILLTSSIATTKVMENHAVYAGTKAAIEAFARPNGLLVLEDAAQAHGARCHRYFDGLHSSYRDCQHQRQRADDSHSSSTVPAAPDL